MTSSAGTRRVRGRLAGRLRGSGHAARDAPGAPDPRAQDRRLAELVCSNSFRGDKLDNAVGLLKEEMRRLGSLVMRAAEASRVPAGGALAVDRERFAAEITARARRASAHHDRPRGGRPDPGRPRHPVILATGPLTSDALSADIARLVGAEHLYFYDAISPIVLAESIDRGKVFWLAMESQSVHGPGKPDAAPTPLTKPVSGFRTRRARLRRGRRSRATTRIVR